jgi:hypothetical protein
MHFHVSRRDCIPCSNREVPSGTYLTSTFRRRYSMKPYSGDLSSYWATAARASPAPPVPRVSTSTASLDAYLSRNLGAIRQFGVDVVVKVGSAPSACLGEGTLVCLCHADMVEPVERHGVLSGGIQEECGGAALAAAREVSGVVGDAGGAFSREVDGRQGERRSGIGAQGVKRGRGGPLVLLGWVPQLRLFTT